MIDKIFGGIEIISDTKSPEDIQREQIEERKKIIHMTEKSDIGYRKMAVDMELVPRVYKDARFDQSKIAENITEQQNKSGHKFIVPVKSFQEYASLCQGIITGIKGKELPPKSYIIGAPNGFGKTSFATDVIISSLVNGWMAVPYVSLSELAEVKLANERRLLAGMRMIDSEVTKGTVVYEDGVYQSNYNFDYSDNGFIKKPVYIIGRYSWSEYMNTPLLVCYFTSLDCKELESHMLQTILSIRAAKGLPTIAMISTSLDPYTGDIKLQRYIWNEILSYDERDMCYDRVFHVSCFKMYTKIINKGKV